MLDLNLGFVFDWRLGLILEYGFELMFMVIKILDLYMFPGYQTAR